MMRWQKLLKTFPDPSFYITSKTFIDFCVDYALIFEQSNRIGDMHSCSNKITRKKQNLDHDPNNKEINKMQ